MTTANPSKPSFIVQKRDLAILRGFLECRVMSGEHVANIYFEGRDESAKKGLQRLKRARFIAERERMLFEPAVLYLTENGLQLLRQHGILQEYPPFSVPAFVKRAQVSPRTLPHELEVMDVKAALVCAIAKSASLSVPEFTTWPLLNQFEADRLVQPDGFMRVHQSKTDGSVSEHRFFLEVDRSTEPQTTLGLLGSSYLKYYQSGGFAERNGARRAAFKDYPFRVLFVLQTEERRNITAETLLRLNPPILTHVWLTTIGEITSDPLGAIWIRPVDYRNATPHAAETGKRLHRYRRNAARDAFVNEKVPRLRLL